MAVRFAEKGWAATVALDAVAQGAGVMASDIVINALDVERDL